MLKVNSVVVVTWPDGEKARARVTEVRDAGSTLILVFDHEKDEEYQWERSAQRGWFEINNTLTPCQINPA